MKMTISYSTRVRKSDNIEIRVNYKRSQARYINGIDMARDYLGDKEYIHKASIWYVLIFNYYMFIKSSDKANKLLDKLLEKAKLRLL